jgi:putative transposase
MRLLRGNSVWNDVRGVFRLDTPESPDNSCRSRSSRACLVSSLRPSEAEPVPASNSVLVGHIELADGEPVGSGRDDVCADFRSRSAPRLDPVTCRAAPRGPRTPASTAGTATVPTSTAAPGESGPVALGVAVTRVGRLAIGRRDREAGNRRRLASPGLPLILDRKSRRRHGRPAVGADARALIRTMSEQNPLWGAPRIHGELVKLGINVSQATVAKYMARRRRPPSQTWRTFLTNHVHQIVAADFFVVPTATCRLLFVVVILAHDRRRVVHTAVTAHPTAAWTAQQFREAFPWDQAPRYLIRDRDHAFQAVKATVQVMGIEEVLTAPRPPWQNACAERFIGSVRRECLDHVIVVTAAGLRKILKSYIDYYTRSRTHLSLEKDPPETRLVTPPNQGPVIAVPQVGGLHHRYYRRAA